MEFFILFFVLFLVVDGLFPEMPPPPRPVIRDEHGNPICYIDSKEPL